MSLYKKELLRAYDRVNIQREQQASRQRDWTAAYDRLVSGGGAEGLSSGAVSMYNKADSEIKALAMAEQARVNAERAATPWIERTWKSVADVGGRIVGGAMKFGENIVDNIATTFGADDEWVKKDHVYDVYGSKLDDYTKSSYLNDGKFGGMVQSAASGIGNMLPSIAANFIIPGAGMPLFMAGAAGGGMESALQQGATRGQAMLYGNIAGIAEGAVEKISGGLGGVGKGVLDNVFKNTAKSAVKSGIKGGVKNAAKKIIGEGLEEVAMDLLDPVLASAYKGKVDYSDVSLGSLAETFAVGGMTGAAMGGGQSVVRKVSPNTDISSKLDELNEIASNLEKNFANGRLTEAQLAQGMQDVQYLRDKVSSRYDRLSERRQDKLVEALGTDSSVLGKVKGTISANRTGIDTQGRAQAQYNRGVQSLANVGLQLTADNGYGNSTGYNAKGISNNIANEQGNSIKYGVAAESGNSINHDVAAESGNSWRRLVTADNGVKYNQVAMSPSIALNNVRLEYAPTAKAITPEQQEVIKSHSKVSGGKTKIVFTDDMADKANADGSVTSFNGAYKDGIIYIPTNSKEPAKVALMHEFNHALEGTAEHSAFTKYVAEHTSTRGSAAAKKYGAFEDVAGKVISDYEVDNIDGDSVEGIVAAQKVSTETVSRYAEQMFSDDKSINRLARANKGKARRALGFITDKLVDVTAKKHPTAKDRELRQYLLRAEQLYRKAIQAAPNKSTKRMISTGDDDKRGAGEKGAQFYITKAKGGRDVVVVEHDILYNVPEGEWVKTVKNVMKKFSGGIPVSGKLVKVNAITRNEYTQSNDTKQLRQNNKIVYKDKLKAANHSDEIVLASTNYINEDLRHERTDSMKEFARGKVLVQVGENKYIAEVIVGFTSDKNMLLYDVVGFKRTEFIISHKKIDVAKDTEVFDDATSIYNSMHQSKENVNSIAKDFTQSNVKSPKNSQNTAKTARNKEQSSAIDSESDSDIQYSQRRSGKNSAEYIQAASAINGILDGIISTDRVAASVSDRVMNSATDLIIMTINGANNKNNRFKAAQNVADYIINNTTLENHHEGEVDDVYMETVQLLKPYMHNIDLRSIKADISNAYDKDNSPYLMWAAKKGTKGQAPDVIAQELAIMGMQIEAENSAEIFFEIDSRYKKASKALKNLSKEMLSKTLSAEEHTALNARIVEELLAADRETKRKAKLKILTKSELRAKAKDCFEDVVLDFLPKLITQGKQKYSLNKPLRLGEIFENVLGNNAFYDLCRGSDGVINKLVNKVIENAVYTNAEGDSITLTTCKGTRYRHVKYDLAHDLVKELSIDGVLDGRQTMQYAQAAAEGEARRAVRYYDKQLQQYYSRKHGLEEGKLVEQKLRLKKEQEKYYSKRQDVSEYEKGLRVQVKIIDFINKKIKKIDTGDRRYHDGVLARDEMRDLIKAISSLPFAGKISNVDKVITALKGALSYIKLYSGKLDTDSVAGFSQDTIDGIEYLIEKSEKSEKSGMRSITNRSDMNALYRIIQAVEHQYRNHSAVVINGNMHSGLDIANKAYQEAQFAGSDAKIGGRMLDKAMQIATDPRTVIARAFGATSDNAEMMKLFTELTRCESLARAAAIELVDEVESFMKKNKNYKKALDIEMIKLGDIDITLGEAINIDMQRSQYGVDDRLNATGIFGIRDKRKRIESKSISKAALEGLRNELAKSKWSEQNKEFVRLLELGYLASNAMKIDGDMATQGYTLIKIDGKYVPMQVEKSVINNSWLSARENVADNFVSEYSINKHRVNNAMAQLRLTSAYDAFIAHSQQLANYRHMTLALRNMDIVLNQNVNVGMGVRKETLGEYVFKNNSLSTKQYLVQLFQDIQGVGKGDDGALSKIRSSWVKSVLGANIKTVLNQFSGLPMASIYIKHRHLISGVSSRFTGYKKESFNAYSEYGVARTYDRSAARAKGISGKIGWFGNLTTAGIQIADNAMMHSIWNACIAQIESQVGHKLAFESEVVKDDDGNDQVVINDTADKANWAEVAELFEKTVRYTQSNDFAAEKTGGQRHKNEVLRFMLGIFSGDAAKMLSNMVRNISYYRNAGRAKEVCDGQIKELTANINAIERELKQLNAELAGVHKNDAKSEETLTEKIKSKEYLLKRYSVRLANATAIGEGLTADRSRAGKMFMKSLGAFAQSQVMFILISLLFSLMRDEKDKDGNELDYGKEFAKRLGDSVVGLFPIVRDIVPALTKGYKMEHYAYSLMNDVIDNIVAVGNVTIKAIDGQQVTGDEAFKAVRGLLFSMGATAGVPLRNIERIARTVTGNNYAYTAAIYGAKTKDINNAIASGKSKQAKEAYRVKLMRDYGGAALSDQAIDIMFNHYSESYKKTSVGDRSFVFNLPSGVPSKISASDTNGAVTELIVKSGDAAIFRGNFALATADINALVLSAKFKQLTAKEQAKAIDSMYARYYDDSKQALIDKYNAKQSVSNDKKATSSSGMSSGNAVWQSSSSGTLIYKPTSEQIISKVMKTTDMATLLGAVSTMQPDKLPNGKTRPHSMRAKVLRALNSYGLTYADKEVVLLTLGYAPTNKAATRRAIARTALTDTEKVYLLGKLS